jgi:protein-tyrosine phosphatase
MIIACNKVPVFDHIMKNVYLGDIVAATDVACLKGIDVIVNVSNTRYDQQESIEYHHFDIADDRCNNISQYFNVFVDIINRAKDKNILVHCMNGVSRSVSLVLYYLMTNGMTLSEALMYVKSKRKQYVRPNVGFFKQLLSAEKQMFGTNSIKLAEFLLL